MPVGAQLIEEPECFDGEYRGPHAFDGVHGPLEKHHMILGPERRIAVYGPDYSFQDVFIAGIDGMERCRNGLEAAAFRRFGELRDLHAELQRRSGRAWRLCGSGSSMFTTWDTADEAAGCARGVRARFGIRADDKILSLESSKKWAVYRGAGAN